MKIRRFLQLGLASVLSLSSLLVISVPAAFAAGPFSCTWTGAGSDSNFSTAANWSGCNGSSPQTADNDDLIFPLNASNLNPVNDLSGAQFGTISLNGTAVSGGYTISGNAMSTTGVNDNSINSFGDTITAPVGIKADGNIVAGNTQGQLTVNQLNIGDFTPDLSYVTANSVTSTGGSISTHQSVVIGDASIGGQVIFVDGDLTVSGAITGSGNLIDVFGGGILKGSGSTSGDIVIESDGTIAPGNSPGCLNNANLTLNGTYQAQIGGTTACTDYDQIVATGSVDVTGATLQTSFVNGFTSTAGQAFTIIDNQGSSPVTGTFSGLAEGATFTVGSSTFKISYVGGDGNDVVLTDVTPAASAAASAPKTPDTGFGLVAAHPLVSFVSSLVIAVTILGIARRLKPAVTEQR